MAFGHPTPEKKINIDYSRCTPVAVITTFAMDGKYKPLYFLVQDEYGNECKTKITGIKFTKQCNGYTSFCCAYSVGSRQRECILTYYLQEHLWVLEH